MLTPQCDCNVVLMDWTKGARGPQYATAAANTELVGRQLAILLLHMINAGLRPGDVHLVGFSLGAHVAGSASEIVKMKGHLVGRITGLDAASPLFRNNNLREKYKKLDREDAQFVDVIHTDASPVSEGEGWGKGGAAEPTLANASSRGSRQGRLRCCRSVRTMFEGKGDQTRRLNIFKLRGNTFCIMEPFTKERLYEI